MIQIKIYDKSFTPLTTFNNGEYTGLNYRKTLGQIGEAAFVVPLENDKVIIENVRNYNRIEILDDGVVQWLGYIVTKHITFNQVEIQCKEMIGILGHRLVSSGYPISTDGATAVSDLLSYINGIDDTGISMGLSDVSATVSMTFNQQDALSILQSIADNVGAQFKVNEDRTLDFKMNIGTDLSSSIQLEYNTIHPQQANLLNFDVSDNGENIVTRAYGINSSLSTQQDDTGLQAIYGILEKFDSFTQANDLTNLEALTRSTLSDTLFSPTLNLIPDEADSFNIGDLVTISIKNKIVDIDDTFQILEKSVKITGSQKTISVKINQLPQDIVNTIRDLQKKVNLLETN